MISTSDGQYAKHWEGAVERPRGLAGNLRWNLRNLYLDAASAIPTGLPDRFLKCLCCHYVFDDQIEAFEAMIRKLKNLGTFVTADDCLDIALGRQNLDGRFWHLSFDDGFRNVITNALPILERHEVPMTFFVPTALVGSNFAEAQGFCQRERYQQVVEFVSWDDLRNLDSGMVTIGSHTKNHPRLSDISCDPALLKEEVAGSKADIEKALGRDCTLLAWPRGQEGDIDEVSLAAIKAAGYEAAFGAYGGSVVTGDPRALVIPRQHFEPQWPLRHVMYLSKRS